MRTELPVCRPSRPRARGTSFVVASFTSFALVACDPVEPVPYVPTRDTSYDANLDAAIRVLPDRDAPPFDAPRPDTPGVIIDEDAGDPDFDGGTVLPILIDGVLDEVEWDGALVASSSAVGVGEFAGCSLGALRVLDDDVYIYVAVEATLCGGVLYLFADTGAPGVNLALTGLGDMDGDVDAATSRILSLVDPSFSPRYAWGTSLLPVSASAASDTLGWRELSQDGPHRHFTSDWTECSDAVCETRVPRSALGSPSTLKLTLRIGSALDGSFLALPPDSGAGEAITTFATVRVSR